MTALRRAFADASLFRSLLLTILLGYLFLAAAASPTNHGPMHEVLGRKADESPALTPSADCVNSTTPSENLRNVGAPKEQDQDTVHDPASKAPAVVPSSDARGALTHSGSAYWMESVSMNGSAPYAEADYKASCFVFRNVRDYGAVGDGRTDDTEAINRAVTDGDRCGLECGSSTKKPAVIYFPGGVYLVSSPIVQYYHTQFIGNPLDRPRIVAAKNYKEMGVMATNVYIPGGGGKEWYTPQNNFQRSIRNFVIDITDANPRFVVSCIHWQVAQATDLQNIDFVMKSGTKQQGIFMENGSGGTMVDLLFTGGNVGAWLGNQQFTARNLVFVNCKKAVQIHWDWTWTMHRVTILGGNDSRVGIDLVGGDGPGGKTQGVGSFALLDSTITNVPVGISASVRQGASPALLIQNTKFVRAEVAVKDAVTDQALVAGGPEVHVDSWGIGRAVQGKSGKSEFLNGTNFRPGLRRAAGLTRRNGDFFSKSAPNYKDVPSSKFLNIKSWGAMGDGKADDTEIINEALARAASTGDIVFFPYGDYVVSDTIDVPPGSRIVGQVWSQIRGAGERFSSETAPLPVIRVGRPGSTGSVEISDMLFTTTAGAVGAKVVEWNIRADSQGSAAIWNSPIRVGGAAGTGLQTPSCPKESGAVNLNCTAAAMLFHLTPSSSGYLDNVWMWTADHDLDNPDQEKIDVYAGRGILIESRHPSWLWGTASEHNVLYQYQISNAKDLFMGMIQTESPYFQPVPKAPAPFKRGVFPSDPDFRDCSPNSALCAVSWALRIINSSDVDIFGAGLYSWYSGYSDECLAGENCQDRVVQVEQSSGISLYNLVTKGTTEMVSALGAPAIGAVENKNGFLASILGWYA